MSSERRPEANNFPFEKVAAAKRYIYALKPWWARFGEHMKVTPIFVPAGEQWGGMTSSDQDMRLFIDNRFANNAPLHVLAGSIEMQFQMQSRKVWERLQWMQDENPNEMGNICFDMEVTSALDEEYKMLSMDDVKKICDESNQFDGDDLLKWGVTDVPSVGDSAWRPEMFSLQPGLSAEVYYRVLNSPPESYGDDEENEGEQEQEQDSGDEGSDAEKRNQDPNKYQDSSDEDEDSGDESSGAESDDGAEASDKPSGDDDESEGSGESEEGGEGQDEDNAPEDEASSGSGESDPESSEDSGDAESASDTNDAEGGDSSNGDASGEGSEPKMDATFMSKDEVQSAVSEMREQSVDLDWWAQALDLGGDDPQFWNYRKEELGSDPERSDACEQAEVQLAEDVKNQSPDFGLSPGSMMIEFADEVYRKRGRSWTTLFQKMVSRGYTSTIVKGQSDMAYSVRNPNQPRKGPILMGMYSHAPKIMELVDVSGSMIAHHTTKLEVIEGISSAVMSNFGDPVTWVTADVGPVDVGTSLDIGKYKGWKPMGYGFGGTSFGKVLSDIMEGRFEWKKRRYPAPDMLVLVSDGKFVWPSNEMRWDRGRTAFFACIVIKEESTKASDGYEGMDRQSIIESEKSTFESVYKPKWLVEGKNFIYAADC